MNLLSVNGVSHNYPHHVRVLHEIQLAIAPGETVALLGRSGCGKSTRRGCWWAGNAAARRYCLARHTADRPEGRGRRRLPP